MIKIDMLGRKKKLSENFDSKIICRKRLSGKMIYTFFSLYLDGSMQTSFKFSQIQNCYILSF